jgi:hypothetical protein
LQGGGRHNSTRNQREWKGRTLWRRGWEEKGLESKQRHLRSLSGVMGAKIETIEQVTKRGYGKSNQIKKKDFRMR